MASAAAYALFGIDPANAVLIRVNGLHRASLAARGGLALTTGVGEVRPVVLGIQTVAVAAGVQVARHLHAGNVAGAAAVVGQRAVDLATLAAHAAIRVHHQQTLRECPYANLVLGHRFFRHAQRTQHRGGQRQSGQTLAGELQELTAGVVPVKKARLISHVVLSSLYCIAFDADTKTEFPPCAPDSLPLGHADKRQT